MGYIVRSLAAYLNHNRFNRRLNINDNDRPDNASQMVLACILGLLVIIGRYFRKPFYPNILVMTPF